MLIAKEVAVRVAFATSRKDVLRLGAEPRVNEGDATENRPRGEKFSRVFQSTTISFFKTHKTDLLSTFQSKNFCLFRINLLSVIAQFFC